MAGQTTNEQVVFQFDKNQREQIRATLSVYKGREVASLRIWYDADENNENGEPIYRPSPKGITISRSKLEELRAAVDALIEAERGVERAA